MKTTKQATLYWHHIFIHIDSELSVEYRQTSNTSRTKPQNLNVFLLVY